MLLFNIRWCLWFCFYMLTGFHGIHVIMVPYLFDTIYTFNKDHFLPEVIWDLKLGLVLAFCRCCVVASFCNVYAYGSNAI